MATIADTVGCNVATDLSLSDAARVLSKTPRQVRTMIKQGELASHKSPNGRWVVDSEALPLSLGPLDARARPRRPRSPTSRAPLLRRRLCRPRRR